MRASKDNLSADALDKRLRVLIKIPRDLKIHVCNMDIHSNGSETALHEDLRTHVLEQKKEIELLQTRDAESQKAIAILETRLKGYEEEIAKRPSIDTLSAKVEVLEAENESLKNFLKESSEEETKKRKELLEKHAQEVSDLAKKLKESQQRVQTLASKNKSYEAEAEAIDKMIFYFAGSWVPHVSLYEQ
ncbi:hypothetical protein QYE76_056643 [Lolium multiflorum]|uniref:Uncharacterized protein n=1 Tax=Lolium multiflorum TaxID=4521 RepID=A0AAD8WN11_LOLMU|nr:hypothetical protein QYE76_056643 [Lolium multiflorum]